MYSGVQARVTNKELLVVCYMNQNLKRGGEVEPGQFHTCERGQLLIIVYVVFCIPILETRRSQMPGGAEPDLLVHVDGFTQQTPLYGELRLLPLQIQVFLIWNKTRYMMMKCFALTQEVK
jgi:hypothetical protein